MMRALLGIACLLAILASFLSWQGDRGRVRSERVQRVSRTTDPPGHHPVHRVEVRRRVEAPSSSLRSQALTIALASFGLALLGAAVFWDRLDEFRIGALWFKLNAGTVRRIRQRTDDSEKALDAVEIYLGKVGKAVEEGRRPSERLAENAADAAVAEVQSDLADQVQIGDPDLPEIEIKGAPGEEQVLWATSEEQYLPAEQFPPELIEEIEREDRPNPVQRIFVLEPLQVLAAVSYEAPPGAPLLVHAIATRRDREELRARALAASLLALRYLHQVSIALSRPAGLVIAVDPDRAQPLTLQELGFRKAGPEETPGLPGGDYWIQERSE